MLKNFFTLIIFLTTLTSIAQEKRFIPLEVSVDKFTTGTLLAPENNETVPLVIIIQGSGPTDRNGNQTFFKNDASKQLAEKLAENNIASYRYDKRIFKMQELGIKEKDMRFDDFITDAVSILNFFKDQKRFSEIIIAGHSEGSLIGMIAAQSGADAFISIAGAGEKIHQVVLAQLEKQVPGLRSNAEKAFEEMIQNGSTSSYNPALETVFRPSVQPYMLSWMHYDPAVEIAKLDIPVLLLNGTKDLQIPEKQAEILKEAKPDATLVIIEKMNHVMKIVEGDDIENAKTYNEPMRPIATELVEEIIDFVKNLE